jgi:glycerol-3-phosphate dehydrogenase (NAD(P)+)
MVTAVIGGGSWGTALAKVLCTRAHTVRQWFRTPSRAAEAAEKRENSTFLPGILLPDNLQPMTDLAAVLRDADLVVVVTPSHAVREVMEKARKLVPREAVLVTASKGIEEGTFRTMSDVLAEIFPDQRDKIAVLSGPSFAREVASEIPTAVTAASSSAPTAHMVQHAFTTPAFRVYTSGDVTGVELGGAVKNVIAVAAGVSDGLGLGHSTRAALITRGLAETGRLAASLGADPRTLAGLSGLGDLVVTCTGDLSRNRQVGLRLGKGEPLKAILDSMAMVAEGVRNTRSVRELARKLQVDMPITEEMFALLYEDKSPRQVVGDLMSRELKAEVDDG